MPNPFTDVRREARWETALPEINMEQLRAPECLDWLRYEAKPAEASLGTFALKSMFDRALISLIVTGQYREVIRRLVSTWPELLTVGSAADERQARPLAKAAGR